MKAVPLAPGQVAAASEVVARAFLDSPDAVWALPDPARRFEVLRWMTAADLRYGLSRGEVYTTEGDVHGIAIWIPPGGYPMSLFRMLLAGWVFAPLAIGIVTLRRFIRVANHYDRLHRREVPGPHWYLAGLGVDPPRQGQGIGGALLEPVLARADREGVPCYLETVTERNLRFYDRHGFQVVVDGDLPDGGPHFWTMKREPQR